MERTINMPKYCQTNEDVIMRRILLQLGMMNGTALEFGGLSNSWLYVRNYR